jgi:SAM-dependent methyltransferase
VSGMLKGLIKALIPARLWRALAGRWRRGPSPDWGDLRKLQPVSRTFGLDRGTPVDRHYIEGFLAAHAADIRGRVLEIGGPDYTRRFGGERVTRSDVLHAVAGNPLATLVGDLATGQGVPAGAFDCIILTQTLPFIYDLRGAVQGAFRALAPGGVLLVTVPGISQISRHDMDRWGDYWRFTDASLRRLLAEAFGEQGVSVEPHGNVLTACALLQGLAAEELTGEELDCADADYQVIIAARAVKAGG